MKKLIIPFLSMLLLFSCSKDEPIDLCAGVICRNGGNCINGDCDCPEGFSGPDCSTIDVPRKVTIKSIKVVDYPSVKPDGTSWDDIGEHDPVVKIYSENETLLWSSTIKQNIPYTKPQTFACDLVLPESDGRYIIRFIDDDGILGSDQMMGWFFNAYGLFGTYSSPLTVGSGDSIFELTMDFDY